MAKVAGRFKSKVKFDECRNKLILFYSEQSLTVFTDLKQKQKTPPQKYSLKLADYYIIISLSLHYEFHGHIGPEFCDHKGAI